MNAIKTAILTIVSFVFFAGVIEFTSYLVLQHGRRPAGINYFSPEKPSSRVPYAYHPLLMHSQRPETRFGEAGSLRTDRYGYVEVPERSPNPALTIVMLGSSAAHLPVPAPALEDTLAYQIQTHLRERIGNAVNVVSLAVPSYTSFQEMLELYEYLEDRGLRADLVLSVGGSYSTIRTLRENPKTLHALYDANRTRQYQKLVDHDLRLVLPLLGAWFTENTNTGKLMQNQAAKLSRVRAKKRPRNFAEILKPNDEMVERLAKRQMINYEIMNLLSERAGAKFMAFLFPVEPKLQGLKSVDVERYQAEGNWIYAVYNRMIAKKEPFPLIDLRDFTPPPEYFSDPHHFKPSGTKALAKAIAERMAPEVDQLRAQKAHGTPVTPPG